VRVVIAAPIRSFPKSRLANRASLSAQRGSSSHSGRSSASQSACQCRSLSATTWTCSPFAAANAVVQVEHDAALAAVQGLKVRALSPGEERRERSRVVAARGLDLHDVGPEVGERQAAEGRGDQPRELDDPQPREQARRRPVVHAAILGLRGLAYRWARAFMPPGPLL
jgi:hypothetical protein